MKQPSLKEVKEYFKNAKIVVPVGENTNVDITKEIQEGVHEWGGHFWIDLDFKVYKGVSVLLWDKDSEKYAEILTYKEKTFSITESKVRELIELTGFESKTNDKLKELFPEVFKSEVKELKIGAWYKSKLTPATIINCQIFTENEKVGYGVHMNHWSENWGLLNFKDYVEATEQEVFEALKNEAVKRGFIYDSYSLTKDNYLHGDNGNRLENVFSNGIWETVPTITLSEAEQQLKKKIIV